MSSSRPSTTSSRLEALLLLDAYSKVHEKAGDLQKSCCWSITKARHSRRREIVGFEGQLSATHVREELRARVVIQLNKGSSNTPPPLMDDDDENNVNNDKKTKKAEDSSLNFTLIDVVEELERRRQPPPSTSHDDPNILAQEDKEDALTRELDPQSYGLRHRKGKSTAESKHDDATKTVVEEPIPFVMDEDEEELRRMNPLEILGGSLPPRELKTAQVQARESLLMYVEAANKAAAILKMIQRKSSA